MFFLHYRKLQVLTIYLYIETAVALSADSAPFLDRFGIDRYLLLCEHCDHIRRSFAFIWARRQLPLATGLFRLFFFLFVIFGLFWPSFVFLIA